MPISPTTLGFEENVPRSPTYPSFQVLKAVLSHALMGAGIRIPMNSYIIPMDGCCG